MTPPAHWAVRHRVGVVLAWTGITIALAPRAAHVTEFLTVMPPIAGQAAVVDKEMAARFPTPFVNYVILVIGGGPLDRESLDSVVRHVARIPGVLHVRTYEHSQDTLFHIPSHGATLVVVGLDDRQHVPESVVPELRRATTALHSALTRRFPKLTFRWTGRAALNADLLAASSADVAAAERRALPITLLVLIVALGTLAAALVPVGSGMLVVTLALGIATIIGARIEIATLAQSFIVMIGLGLGIDYALLIVSRFRERLSAGADGRAAASDAARAAGGTIVVSGTVVAVGFVALLAIPHHEFRAAAVGGSLSAATAVLLSVSLVPALLSWLGAGVNRVRLWPARWTLQTATVWHRWGQWIVARPLRVLTVAVLPVAFLAWQGHRLRTGLPRGGGNEWLPSGLEATAGLQQLETMGRRGIVQTIHILMILPAGADVLTRDGWSAVRRMRELLTADPRIAAVQSFNSFTTNRPLSRLTLFMMPQSTWRPFLSEDRRAVLLHAVPVESSDEAALAALVRRLRALDPDRFTGIAGARILVGGLPAARTDYVDAVSGQFGTVATLVLLGTCVALFIGLRSLLVPLKAIVLNLLAVGCGFGAVVLVFQDGWGLGLFDVAERLETVFPILPTIVFCTVFGLSMDYEVFLVTRVAEATRQGMDDRAAIVAGLATTGPVITSAAAIMVTVFGAFMLGKFLLIQMLGLALAVAVFLDATLIRSAIGPALLTLAGRWNWWPGRTNPH